MDFRHSVKAKNPATATYLANLAKDTTYVKNGIVFRRDPESGKTIEALGPVSGVVPDKCDGCLFWAKKPGKYYTVDGEITIVGCIRDDYGCIDKPIDSAIISKTGISPQTLSKKGKISMKSAWSSRQK